MPKIEEVTKCIGIVGSRRRNELSDYVLLMRAFKEVYRPGDTIVSGGCKKGGDKYAEWIAEEMGLTITIHYPKWKELGKVAGFDRNTDIAEQCDVLLAIVAADRTGGTEDTIKKATKLGKKIILI